MTTPIEPNDLLISLDAQKTALPIRITMVIGSLTASVNITSELAKVYGKVLCDLADTVEKAGIFGYEKDE
jgi:hypothetical protein